MHYTRSWLIAAIAAVTSANLVGQQWVNVETTPSSGLANGIAPPGFNTPVTFPSTSLTVPTSLTVGNLQFHGASTTITASSDPSATGVVITEEGAAQGLDYVNTYYAGLNDAPFSYTTTHSFTLEFNSVQMVAGDFVFSLSGSISNTVNSNCRFQIDIDDDGSIEQTFIAAVGGSQTSWQTPTSLPGTGTPKKVKIIVRAFASSTSLLKESYAGTFSAEFLTSRTQCSIGNYGSSCGPVLAVTESLPNPTTRSLVFTMTGGFPNQVGAFVFGVTPTNTPIAGTNCFLLNPATVGLQVTTDPFGNASNTWTLPIDSTLIAYAQAYAINLSPYTVKTSQGVQILCY